MKKRYYLAFSAMLIIIGGCKAEELDFRNVQISNGQIFEGKENSPFTGRVMNLPENITPPDANLNKILVVFNQTMDGFKASENMIYGRKLVCDSDISKGFLSGETTCYQPNTHDKRYTVQYFEGNVNGDLTAYDRSGSTLLAKATIKDNVIDGKIEIFGPHTGKLVGEYHNSLGVSNGDQTSWDENTGKMTSQVTLKQGVYVSPLRQWTSAGILVSEIPFVNGVMTGVEKTWWEDGKPKKFNTMVNGVIEGPAQTWDENGQLVTSGTYRKGYFYPDESPAIEEHATGTTDETGCSGKWIDAFHKENGDEAPVNNDQLSEWSQWCTEGKLPN